MSFSTKFIATVLAVALVGKYLISCQPKQEVNRAISLPIAKITVEYEADTEYPLAVELYKTVPMQRVLDEVQSSIKFPNPVRVIVGDCGEINAFYFPAQRTVGMCTELAMYLLLGENMDPKTAADVLTFVFAHELSHAVITELDLPETSSGEDMADGLALFVLTALELEGSALHAADWFDTFGDSTSPGDTHSPGTKRAYAVRCFIAGADAYLGRPKRVEASGRCQGEFEERVKAWSKLLAPHANQ